MDIKSMPHQLLIKRVYEDAKPEDGYRILIDRLWPRGLKKVLVHPDLWAKYMAPSTELRKSFGHVPEKFESFKADYASELDKNPQKDEFVSLVKEKLKQQNVTLLYGAKSETINQAIMLQDYLLQVIKN